MNQPGVHSSGISFSRWEGVYHPLVGAMRVGAQVTLAAEFEPGSEHEGLEGRAGVISSLTEEAGSDLVTRSPSFSAPPFLVGRVPLLKSTTEESWYPYANLFTGGPRLRISLIFSLWFQREYITTGDSFSFFPGSEKANGGCGSQEGVPSLAPWSRLKPTPAIKF